MKINEVEKLVGITKKNIRFYEEKGLLHPTHLAENGYRDYSEKDVEELRKIKLLRRLSVPIEEIRLVQEEKISFAECMDRQQSDLRKEQENLERVCAMCAELQEKEQTYGTLTASVYLDRLEQLEMGGARFMNVQEQDQRKQKNSSWIAAIVMILFMAAIMGIMIWGQSVDPMPIGFFVVMLAVPVIIIVGVLLALYMRLKEIEGGEANEAAKY